jgi:hypothetical protein
VTPTPYEPALPYSRNAIAGLVLGILGMLSGPAGAGVVGIVAVVLGHIGRRDVHRGVARGNGVAIAALVMGYLAVVATAGYWLRQI